MKNILFFLKSYQFENQASDGTGVFYKNLAESLAKNDYDVYVFLLGKDDFETKISGVKIKSVKKNYFKKHFFQELARSVSGRLGFYEIQQKFYEKEILYYTKLLKNFISKNNLHIDVIETHDWEAMSLFLDDLKIPFVVRNHGCWAIFEKYYNFENIGKNQRWIINLEKKALTKSENQICVSKFSSEIYKEMFGIQNYLIYNKINIPKNNFDVKIIKNSVFFFSWAIPEKGFDIALNAFREIKKQVSDATFHIVGKADFEKIKQENLDISSSMVSYGFLQGEELFQTLLKANLFLFPSKGETFGLALCEAMGLGKVVIASQIPSFCEIIEDKNTGFIAKMLDDYVNISVEILKNNTLRDKIEQNAKNSIQNKFNPEKIFQENTSIYNKIINNETILH